MKLDSLSCSNTFQEWRFDKINFFKLTLLVGISGVGKTQILKAIYSLKRIALGSSGNGIKWDVEFTTLDNNKFRWLGEFDKNDDKNDLFYDYIESDTEKAEPKIINEKLYFNKKLIIKRDSDVFLFNNNEMPKLNSSESALSILKEENLVKEAYESFKLIIFRDHTQKEGIRFGRLSIEKLKKKFKTFKEIKESDLDTLYKLALVYDTSKDVFKSIEDRFIDVFPQVEKIKVEPVKDNDLSSFVFEAAVIQIKEKSVKKWIPQNRISSGMLRTLLHIAEMYLWNEGTVILIDEFENSLGINCIDVLTEDIVYDNENIQFIATSHHPYIINKIPSDYWKIVSRKGSRIQTVDAKEFGIGNSNHDRFMSLINNPVYKDGKS